nr:hypothetical protein [Tanacetum cinerariifolium]
ISSGSTTTHSYVSLSEYDSFIFDLANDQFPPSDRSDFTHEEFADELAHIISPPEYDCFYFKDLLDLGELISIFNSGICENLSSITCVNLPIEDDHSPLLAYVEGEDTFYVTGYDKHGSEIGGYNDLMMQQRPSRILVTLGNDPSESLLLVWDFI